MNPIFLIRFSFLTNEPITQNFPNREAFIDYLYSEERLEYRLKLFEVFCLPSLLNQSDPQFSVVILTSAELPKWAWDRLSNLIAPLNDARIYAKPFMGVSEAFQEILDEHYPNIDTRLMIRLDDDDAVSIDWVQKSKMFASSALGFMAVSKSFAFYPNKGLILNFNHETSPLLEVQMKETNGLGLTLISRPDCTENCYSVAHIHAEKKWLLLSIPNGVNFLRVLHGSNISYMNNVNEYRYAQISKEQDVEKNYQNLAKRFCIDIEKLEQFDGYKDQLILPKQRA